MEFLAQTLLVKVYGDQVQFSWLSLFFIKCLSASGTSMMINYFYS